ncbi:MAG: DNA polymerase domain-containing protein [Candidatus Hodarchaeales archaeon]
MNTAISFILLDADYDVIIRENERRPFIRLWGRLNSKLVEVRVHGFLPYFYAEASEAEVNRIFKQKKKLVRDWLVNITKQEKKLYFGGTLRPVVKINGTLPYRVPEIKKVLQQSGIVVHEADIPFTRRFLVDRNLRAMHSIKVKGKLLQEDEDSIIIESSYLNISASQEHVEAYQPVLMAFDIEVNEYGETFQELLLEKKQRITAISMAWGTIKTDSPNSEVIILKADNDDSEIILLNKFTEMVRKVKPDILLSFNGTFFDIPYLEVRMAKYGTTLGNLSIFEGLQDGIIKTNIPVESFRIKGRAVVDLVPRTWGIHHVSGKKNLDSIAEQVLGESKVELEKSHGQLWRDSILGVDSSARIFREYCLKDAILTYRLAFSLGVLDSVELCRLSGYPLPEGILSTHRNIGEYELMRILHNRNILIPPKPDPKELRRRNEEKKKFPHLGGWVIDPNVDEALFVAILDFRSLYPNIVRTHNISGEMLAENPESLSAELRFRKDHRGALAELMNRILKQRYQILAELKDLTKIQKSETEIKQVDILKRVQRSLKLMANSLLGASNYPRGRFYSGVMANSITAIARDLLSDRLQKWTKEFSSKHQYKADIRYGDTDSIFVEFLIPNLDPTLFQGYTSSNITFSDAYKRLLQTIEEYRDFLLKKLPEFLELQLEDIALRIILKKGRKKAYAYLSLSNEVVIKGFEAVRSDWSPLARKTQKNLLETLLKDFTKSRMENAYDLVYNVSKKILTNPLEQLMEDLVIRGPLKRSPEKYRTKTPAIGAFLHYCQENNIDPDKEYLQWDGFPYIIAKGPANHPQYKRAFHPDVFRSGKKKIDRMHYVKEIVGASNRFGILIDAKEAYQKAFVIPLTTFL